MLSERVFPFISMIIREIIIGLKIEIVRERSTSGTFFLPFDPDGKWPGCCKGLGGFFTGVAK